MQCNIIAYYYAKQVLVKSNKIGLQHKVKQANLLFCIKHSHYFHKYNIVLIAKYDFFLTTGGIISCIFYEQLEYF
jgi:hypothetical protein